MTAHKERAHALLSASGAHRWMVCTPSAVFEEQFKQDEQTSVYAEEGTFAHELAEAILRFGYASIRLEVDKFAQEMARLKKSDFYSFEMQEEVEKYTDYVSEIYRSAKAKDKYSELRVEDKFDLSQWIPEGFGTNDAVVLVWDEMHVCDLKFGKGVKVSATDNDQLKLYALGALEKHGLSFNIEKVVLHIVQPRIGNFSTFELSVAELMYWAEKEVKVKAALAFEGKGEFVPGDHCRFCKAAVRCKALADKNLEIAKYEFREPNELTDSDLLDIFERVDPFIKWANSIQAFVLSEALKGKVWHGYKLVEGRSNRQISNEAKALEALQKAGFTLDKVVNTKIKGLGDLEKLLGKKEFAAVLNPFVTKPGGKPTLVTVDDPRPEINSTEKLKEEFGN